MSSPLCLKGAETVIHAPRDCEVIKPIWIKLGIAGNDNNLFSCNLSNWLAKIPNPTVTLVQTKPPWKFTFLFANWVIWQKRNFVVFQNKPFPCYLMSEISQRALEFVHCAHDARETVCYILKPIRWEQVGPST